MLEIDPPPRMYMLHTVRNKQIVVFLHVIVLVLLRADLVASAVVMVTRIQKSLAAHTMQQTNSSMCSFGCPSKIGH